MMLMPTSLQTWVPTSLTEILFKSKSHELVSGDEPTYEKLADVCLEGIPLDTHLSCVGRPGRGSSYCFFFFRFSRLTEINPASRSRAERDRHFDFCCSFALNL